MNAGLRLLFVGAVLVGAACGGESGSEGVPPDSLSAPAGFFRALEAPLCAAVAACAGKGAQAIAGCGYAIDVDASGGCPAMIQGRAVSVIPATAAGGYCYYHPADIEFTGSSLATKCLAELQAVTDPTSVACVGPEGAQTSCDGVAREFSGGRSGAHEGGGIGAAGKGGDGEEGGAPAGLLGGRQPMTATAYLALPASCSCVLVPRGAVVPETCTALAADTDAVKLGSIRVGGICGQP